MAFSLQSFDSYIHAAFVPEMVELLKDEDRPGPGFSLVHELLVRCLWTKNV